MLFLQSNSSGGATFRGVIGWLEGLKIDICKTAQQAPLSSIRYDRQIALTSKLKAMGQANMAPNPIILRYHFGNFVN